MYIYIKGKSWVCQFSLKDTKGRLCRYHRSLGLVSDTTKTEAKRQAERIRLDIKDNLDPIKKSNISITELINEYINRSEVDYSLHTLAGYKTFLRNYIEPSIGDIPINSFGSMDIDILINYIKKKGLSVKTMTNTKGLLIASLAYAKRQRYIQEIPDTYIRLPVKPVSQIEILTREQAQLVFEYSKNFKSYLPLMTLFYTLARRGEVCGLQYQDIDLNKGILYIRRHLNYLNKTLQVKLPKNNKVREILMPGGLIGLLKEHIENTPHKPTDFLFARNRGYLYPALLYRDYGRIITKIEKHTGTKIPTSLHAIRHYMISELIAAGIVVLQ